MAVVAASPSAHSRHNNNKSHHGSSHHHHGGVVGHSRSRHNNNNAAASSSPQEETTPSQQQLSAQQPTFGATNPSIVQPDASSTEAAGGNGDEDVNNNLLHGAGQQNRRTVVQAIGSSTSRTRDGHIRIGVKWTLGQRIGAGNFGQVYIGYDIDGFQKYCIKIEKCEARSPQLNREYRFYHMLRGHHGFPRVYWYGQVQKYNCLVMDLLGPSLDDLHGICSRRFSMKTTCIIGLQLIDRFEVLHSKGLIYRDVKPENFLLGRRSQSKENVVFVVDMGLAKLYRDARTGEHLPEAFGQAVTGTARYMSINANFGNEQSRRDDMEALGHLLIFFLRSRLPWQGLKPGNAVKDHIRLIGQVKRDTAVSELCEGLPEEFSLYISYCRHLDFYAKPDYEYLRELFIDLCERNGWKDDGVYDWTEKEDQIMRHSQHSMPNEPIRLGSAESRSRADVVAGASKTPAVSGGAAAAKPPKRQLSVSAKPYADGGGGAGEIQVSASTPHMPTAKHAGSDKKAKQQQAQSSLNVVGGAVAKQQRRSAKPSQAATAGSLMGASNVSQAGTLDDGGGGTTETTPMPVVTPSRGIIANRANGSKKTSNKPSAVGATAGRTAADGSTSPGGETGGGGTLSTRFAPNQASTANNDDDSSIVFKFLCIRIRRKRHRPR